MGRSKKAHGCRLVRAGTPPASQDATPAAAPAGPQQYNMNPSVASHGDGGGGEGGGGVEVFRVMGGEGEYMGVNSVHKKVTTLWGIRQ